LYFYNARWFDNEIGRFAQADSIIPEPGNPVAWDRYAYVNNNPIRYNDPSGHCIECFVLGGFMGVGALIGYGSQVAKNYQNGIQGMAAYTTNIELEPIWRGAIITGGVVIAAAAVVTVASTLAPTVGILTNAACLDGDCSNEVTNVVETLNKGLQNTDLRFSQITASPKFSMEGLYKGETIGTLAEKIRIGLIDSSEIGIGYVQRGEIKLIENTRSSIALLRAGISPSKWNLINNTGNLLSESNITERLIRNGLTDIGIMYLRLAGLGKNMSNLE